MKKNVRTVLLCLACWAVVLAVCFGLLCAAAAVPDKCIENNLRKSSEQLARDDPHGTTLGNTYHSIQDNYADAVLLGVAANMTSDSAVKSALDTKYYDDGYGPAVGISETLDGKQANIDYTRYWHGSLTAVRPLLALTDLSGIRLIGTIIIIVLMLGNAALLIYKKHIAACVILMISAVLVQFWFVFTTIEYMIAFIITLAAIPLYVKFADRPRILIIISAGVGTITAFADFLTTETLTILVPLTMAFFIIAKKGEKPDNKKSLITAVSSITAWGACYLMTFAAKWFIASSVLGKDISDTAVKAAAERVNGMSDTFASPVDMLFSALRANFTMLTPNGQKDSALWSLLWLGIFAVICFVIFRLNTRKHNLPIVTMIIIASLPVLRFCVLMNHAYLHNYFTYRALMASIMAILGLMWYRIGGSGKSQRKTKRN